MIKILLKFLIIFKKCFVLIWLKEMSPEYSKYFFKYFYDGATL